MTVTLFSSSISSLPMVVRGKVRDIYAVGHDRLLMVATDRISAFDVVLPQPIPGKGELLTQMAMFWFLQLADIVPNHLTGEDPSSVVTPEERAQVLGRSMLVRRLTPLPIEAVVRGYLAGSAWKEYQQRQSVCGISLPAGLRKSSKLPEPIFTPATKAATGDHDENISFEQMEKSIGDGLAKKVRSISINLYAQAAAMAFVKGVIIADTKFEFGLDEFGELILMDEILTPDSSRFWLTASYVEGEDPPSLDKQFLRDWLEGAVVNGSPWNKRAPAPDLPQEIIEKTVNRYRDALDQLIT